MELRNACQTQQRDLVVEVNVQGSESGADRIACATFGLVGRYRCSDR